MNEGWLPGVKYRETREEGNERWCEKRVKLERKKMDKNNWYILYFPFL